MKNKIFFVITATVSLLTGCATAPTPVEVLSKATLVPDKATLIAENDGWGRVLVPMQIQKNSRFETLNGERVSTFINSVTEMALDPGEHILEVSCSFRRGTALQLTNSELIQMHFEAENVYYFRVVLRNGTCGIEAAPLQEPDNALKRTPNSLRDSGAA